MYEGAASLFRVIQNEYLSENAVASAIASNGKVGFASIEVGRQIPLFLPIFATNKPAKLLA